MKKPWILSVSIVLIAWSTLPFLGKSNIKRYLPASILISLIEGLNVQIARKRKWWIIPRTPRSFFFREFPYNIGPHLVGSMWILKWTYGNFIRYILLNALVDGFFAFPFAGFLEKTKMFKLVRINHFQFFLYIFYKAFLLYGIQSFFENKAKNLIK